MKWLNLTNMRNLGRAYNNAINKYLTFMVPNKVDTGVARGAGVNTYTRASTSYGQNADGDWIPYSNNVPVLDLLSNRGLLVEPPAVNVFSNSAAPATQTISLTTANAGAWTTTVFGDGTITITAGTGTATNLGTVNRYTPRTITVTGAGTFVFTLSGGTPTCVNVENSTYGTSPLVGAGSTTSRAQAYNLYQSAGNIIGATGTIILEVFPFTPALAFQPIISSYNGTTGGSPVQINNGVLTLYDGTANKPISASNMDVVSYRVAVRWNGAVCSGFVKGVQVDQAFDGDLSLNSSFGIGCNISGTGSFNGFIKLVSFYNTLLSNEECVRRTLYVEPFNYYVNSVSGSDAANGLTPATAFQTISKLKTVATSNNLKIGLAKGSYWREELDLSVYTGVAVGSYGRFGTAPSLDGADVITGWAKTGGYTNVYDKSLTGLAVQQHQTVWENGVKLVRVASIAACDATAGSFYVTDTFTNGGAYSVYVNATGSGNPNVNGKTYECAQRLYSVFLGDSGIIDGIRGGRQAHNDGSLKVSLDSTISNCVAYGGYQHNFFINTGTVNKCYAYDCEIGYDFVGISTGSSVGKSVTFSNCIAFHDTSCTGPGFFLHGETYSSATYLNNKVYNHANGIDVSGFRGTITITDLEFEQVGAFPTGRAVSLASTEALGGIASINKLRSSITGTDGIVYAYGTLAGDTINVYDSELSVAGASLTVRNGAGTMNIDQCTFNCAGGGAYGPYDDFGAINMSRTILTGTGLVNGINTEVGSKIGRFSNNVFFGMTNFRYKGSTYDFATWKSIVGDTTSVLQDPLLNSNPDTAGDFSVNGASPAISRQAGVQTAMGNWTNWPVVITDIKNK